MNRNDELIIYSLPVSGASFPCQLALLSEIYYAKKKIYKKFNTSRDYKPDIVLGASGGNVSAYVFQAADWDPRRVFRIISFLNSEMFIRSWFPRYMSIFPTILLSPFMGSLYNYGYGSETLFKKIFDNNSIKDVEIWTGTYNKSKLKAEFFCNKSESDALIQNNYFGYNSQNYDSCSLKYLGDEFDVVDQVAKVCIASASIPLLVKRPKINGDSYGDGGIMYPSPTTPLINEIYRNLKKFTYNSNKYVNLDGEIKILTPCTHEKKLRHFYFSPYDTTNPEVIQSHKTFSTDLTQLFYTNLLTDKSAIIDNLEKIYGINNYQLTYKNFMNINNKDLVNILIDMEKFEHYVCNFYPMGIPTISLEHFTTEDILNVMDVTKQNYGVEIWYYEK